MGRRAKEEEDSMKFAVAQSYNNGEWNKSKLARMFGCSRRTVHRILDKETVRARDVVQKKPGPKPTANTPPNRRKIRSMLNDKAGIPDCRVAKKIGISRQSV